MEILSLILLLTADGPGESFGKKMLPVYVQDLEAYSLTVESAPKQVVELRKEPVMEWVNPARSNQQGAVFLWLRDGRPAALACIFAASRPELGGCQIWHELHALDPEKLVVKRDAYNQWKPQVGLARKELADAAAPAATPGARLVQMRRLAQEFAGHSVDNGGKRWELRLLPTPLYRYPAARTGVVDGALFALVSTAGTDPEVLLVIEATETAGGLRWGYACGRFSDWDLYVQRKDQEVYASVRGPTNPFAHDPLHLYRIYPEKIVSPEGKLLARVRQTPTGRVIIPVTEK
jgi:hypothetical protein